MFPLRTMSDDVRQSVPLLATPLITVHLNGLAPDLVPVPAKKMRPWWQSDIGTRNHANHCLPLTMANSLGYFILSPGGFSVSWDGSWEHDADVMKLDPLEPFVVDNHSACATFTVQPGFIPATAAVGDFVHIRSVPNVRGAWFTVMEALIEAWWQPGEFGIVCMLNRPGTFTVERGEPIAQMSVYNAASGFATMRVDESLADETPAWQERRCRPEYRKDLDYLRGRHPDGREEPTHIRSWSAALT